LPVGAYQSADVRIRRRSTGRSTIKPGFAFRQHGRAGPARPRTTANILTCGARTRRRRLPCRSGSWKTPLHRVDDLCANRRTNPTEPSPRLARVAGSTGRMQTSLGNDSLYRVQPRRQISGFSFRDPNCRKLVLCCPGKRSAAGQQRSSSKSIRENMNSHDPIVFDNL